MYRVYSPTTKRIYSSRNVIIDKLGTAETVSREADTGNEIEITLPEVEGKESRDKVDSSQSGLSEPIPLVQSSEIGPNQ